MEWHPFDIQLHNHNGAVPNLFDVHSKFAFYLAMLKLDPHEIIDQLIMVLCALETITGHMAEDGFDPEKYNPADYFNKETGNGSEPQEEFPVPMDQTWILLVDWLWLRIRSGKWFNFPIPPDQQYPFIYHQIYTNPSDIEEYRHINQEQSQFLKRNQEKLRNKKMESKNEINKGKNNFKIGPRPQSGTTGFQVLTDAEGSPLPELYEFIYEAARNIVKALPSPPGWTSVIIYMLATMESLNPHHAMDSALDDLCRLITRRLNTGKW